MEELKVDNTFFPYTTYGSSEKPILLLLNSFPKTPFEAYSKKFLDLLANDYYLILLSFPLPINKSITIAEKVGNITVVKQEEDYGYSINQLMSIFYQTLLHLNLIHEKDENDPAIKESFRRLSFTEDLLHKKVSFRELLHEAMEEGEANNEEEEEENDEETLNIDDSTQLPDDQLTDLSSSCPPSSSKQSSKPSCSSKTRFSGFTNDTNNSSTTHPSLPIPPVNIFNEDAVLAENRQVRRCLSHAPPLEEEGKGGIPLVPEEVVPLLTPLLVPPSDKKKQSRLPSKNRILAVIGQDYYSNSFLLNYQNHFPSHFQSMIMLNYGIKKTYYIPEIFFYFSWDWFVSGLFLFSNITHSKRLLGFVWKLISLQLIIVLIVMDFLHSCYTGCLWGSGKLSFSSPSNSRVAPPQRGQVVRTVASSADECSTPTDSIPGLQKNDCHTEHEQERKGCQKTRMIIWKRLLENYSLEMFYLNYQLWKSRIIGIPLELKTPDNCPFLFIVSLFALSLHTVFNYFFSHFSSNMGKTNIIISMKSFYMQLKSILSLPITRSSMR
jgi:hypothetical protein